eukprot:Hpha_TRINITY_DN30691_c0_g1::TRINITY_DN30691_c0_g1_i1::g.18335::m.18335
MPAVIKCSWMDDLFMCLPGDLDPDEVLAFQTERVVRINDRVLGCFALCCRLAVLVYIVADLLINHGHMLIETPVGTSRMTVMLPPYSYGGSPPKSACPGCSNAEICGPGGSCPCPVPWPKAVDEMNGDYCSVTSDGKPTMDNVVDEVRMPCMYWGQDKRYLVPMLGSQLLVTTRLKQQLYDTKCDKAFTGVQPNGDTWNMTAVDPDCVKNTQDYPPSQDIFKGFVAGVEGATIKLDHTVSGQQSVYVEARNSEMHGELLDCDDKESVRRVLKPVDPLQETDCGMGRNSIFTLEELLSVAQYGFGDFGRCGIKLDEPSLINLKPTDRIACRGKNLVEELGNASSSLFKNVNGTWQSECGETIRYSGIVLVVDVHYDNSDGLDAGDVAYTIRVRALSLSEAEFERAGISWGSGRYLYEGRRGVLVMVQQGGTLMVFSFKALLINVTAGLGLLAAAKVITVFMAKKICPQITGDKRYRELIVHESEDMNEEAEERRAEEEEAKKRGKKSFGKSKVKMSDAPLSNPLLDDLGVVDKPDSARQRSPRSAMKITVKDPEQDREDLL